KGCTDEEYRTEVSRVQAYFDSGGRSLLRELEVERDQASVNLEFEAAATTHARVEKVAPVLGQLPEIVQRLDRLSALMVQRATEARERGRFFLPTRRDNCQCAGLCVELRECSAERSRSLPRLRRHCP